MRSFILNAISIHEEAPTFSTHGNIDRRIASEKTDEDDRCIRLNRVEYEYHPKYNQQTNETNKQFVW